MLESLRLDIQKVSNKEKSQFLQRFFKTGEGEYGHGDIFAGIQVPVLRALSRKYRNLSVKDCQTLLMSAIHEERLLALMILVLQMSDKSRQKEIFELYISHTKYVNNWDLVDSSADKIVGRYLMDKPRGILVRLAKSPLLREKRIAIIATYWFIKEKQFEYTFIVAELLLQDKHDLIHKAVGWMLREVGKHCGQEIEEEFLKKHYKIMPRTMLRYSIERFQKELRIAYLKGYI